MWLHHLWFTYFVPSLWGNGPEAIVQTVVYASAAVLFIPPVRRFFKRHFESVHAKLDAHHADHMQRLDQQGEEMTKKNDARFKALHDKLDAQHVEHMDALNRPVNVDTSIPPTKSTKKVLANKVVKKAAPVKKTTKR